MANLQRQYLQQRKRIEREISRLEKRGVNVELTLPSIPKRITKASVHRLEKITQNVILSKSSIYDVGRQSVVSGRAVLGTIQRTKTGKTESYNPVTGEYFTRKEKAGVDVTIPSTGEIQRRKPTKGKPTKRRKQADIPSESDIVIDNTIGEIIDYSDIDSNYPDVDMSDLNNALNELANFQPDPKWNSWMTDQKYKQVRKLLQGIQQAINEFGKGAVAQQWNNNAGNFNNAIDRVIVGYGGTEILDEIDADINALISELGGAMSFTDAIEYGY